MNRQQIIKSLFICPVLAGLVAWAGSQYSQTFNELPTFALCVGLAFIINWSAFIPANLLQTEAFFDLVGSLTYILVTLVALYLTDDLDIRSKLLAALVIIWAVRLGSFLFIRIMQDGKDDRFNEIKPNFLRFLNVWTLQGLWVTLTSAAALIGITSTIRKDIDYFVYIGLGVWLIGFFIEVVADAQKRQFKKNPANKGQFIRSGLWSKSRHPNYFGEIFLWIGVFIIAIPVLKGWQWVALLSPVFVAFLLIKISGIPALEAKADKKWGGQADYEAYKMNTPILIPKLT